VKKPNDNRGEAQASLLYADLPPEWRQPLFGEGPKNGIL
jgi:hypothetical protein